MSITSTNFTDISYVEEVTPGIIPEDAPTSFQIIPTTGGAPAANLTTAVSEVIRSDRQTDDLVLVDSDITGDIDVEISYPPFKKLLIELLRGTPDVVSNVTTVKNSNNQAKTYTFCKRVLGIADPAYAYYTGCVISQQVFNFETGSILTGTTSVFGRATEVATDSVPYNGLLADWQTFIEPPVYTILNSVSNVETTITGLPANTEYSTMNLTINNNTNAAKAIGTLGAIDTADFTLDVTGDISLYFQDLDAYNLFLASGSFSLVSTLTDGLGNELEITMPYCKFETLDTPIPGKDNFLMMDGSFRALRDSINNYMIQFKLTDFV